MKNIIPKSTFLLALLLIGSVIWTECAGAKSRKPHVVILATGGTIAGAAQDKNATVGYKAGVFKVEDLINAVPGLSSIADVKGEQVVNIDSQDMNAAIWARLTNRINELLSKSDVDGVVVTHGTDTLEETAYFLDLTVKSRKPVVVVGSMRPATAISADGPLNLYNAVKIAGDASSVGKGVLVVMNDTIFTSREVSKMNTFKVDTFQAPNTGPIGYIQSGNIYYYARSIKKNTTETPFKMAKDTKELPKVGILYSYAGITADYVKSMLDLGVKGIVVAGVGDGGLGTILKAALKKAVDQGVVVVRSSRVGSGIVARNGEANDDQYGFIVADDLNPQKSRVLLELALMKTKDAKDIQKMFYQY